MGKVDCDKQMEEMEIQVESQWAADRMTGGMWVIVQEGYEKSENVGSAISSFGCFPTSSSDFGRT